MSFGQRVMKKLNDNVVLITGVGIIVSIHWGWSKLQHNTALVPEEKRKELPIILAAKYVEQKIVDEIGNLKHTAPTDKEKPS